MAKVDAALVKRNKESLKKVSPLFDELNQAWNKIEDFFRAQGILQSAQLAFGQLEHWHNPVESEVYGDRLIGVQKVKGKWRVCYGTYHHQYDDTDWTPVSDCSMELRTELLEHVTKLFEKVVEANESYIPEVEQAVAKSHSVLSELGISE